MKTGIVTFDPGFSLDGALVYTVDGTIPYDLGARLNDAARNLLGQGCDHVVFFGDSCRPQAGTVNSHVEHLGSHLYPLVTCGRILHPDDGWKDYRELGRARKLNLFNPEGTIIQNPSALTSGFGISVANFGMNRAALDRIRRFTRTYFGTEGPFPVFDCSHPFGYGKVLSLCAWCSRVTMFMLPSGKTNSVVYEAPGCNPYSSNSCNGDGSESAIAIIQKGMQNAPPGLDFFDSVND